MDVRSTTVTIVSPIILILSLSLERVQKRALKIIYSYDNHYRDALQMAGLKTLKDRREDLCLKFFNSIVSNP